jgi:hypothetical protein
VTLNDALRWAGQTLNERLREAQRTDIDHTVTTEACLETLAEHVEAAFRAGYDAGVTDAEAFERGAGGIAITGIKGPGRAWQDYRQTR